jgi:hypothetical protein
MNINPTRLQNMDFSGESSFIGRDSIDMARLGALIARRFKQNLTTDQWVILKSANKRWEQIECGRRF